MKSIKFFDEALRLNEQSVEPIPNLMKMSVLDSLFYDDLIEDKDREYNLKIIEEILITNSQSRSALILKMSLLIMLANYNEALIIIVKPIKLGDKEHSNNFK